MKRIVAVLLVASLLLGIVACSAVSEWDIGSYFGSIPALAQGTGGTVTVEGNIMAVFYLKADERVLFGCTDVTIESSEDLIRILNPENTSVPCVNVTGMSAETMAYGLYKYKTLPTNLCEVAHYLNELGLEPADYSDLPWSGHIGRLMDVDPNRPKPAQVRRFYMDETYDFWCLVTQTVVDEYIAGDIEIGDWVTVHFMEEIPQSTEYHIAIVTGKVYESWS